MRKGGDREDHSLNLNPGLRKAQDAAVEKVKTNSAVVREVLKSSRYPEDRGAAAWLLGYATLSVWREGGVDKIIAAAAAQ